LERSANPYSVPLRVDCTFLRTPQHSPIAHCFWCSLWLFPAFMFYIVFGGSFQIIICFYIL
jgi:hypothetical protein